MNKYLAILVFLGANTICLAQENMPVGKFKADRVKIGEPVQYTLAYRHDPRQEIIFPDSTYDFSPFELIGKTYFPTATDSTGSLDSIVYTLATFEIDSIQTLSVPVFLVDKKKKEELLPIYPEEDYIVLQELIEVMPDTLALMENTTQAIVPTQFNYPYLLTGLAIFFFVALVVAIAFGKNIRRAWQLRALRKQHTKFLLEFEGIIYQSLAPAEVEKALAKWKTYTGKMLNLPIYSYTTREIVARFPEESLKTSLKNIDRAIYAGLSNDTLKEHLVFLKDYAQNAYKKKVEEVKHG